VVFETLEPWELVYEMDIPQGVRMAAFIDQNFGLTGGPDSTGKAHITQDGGKTWTAAGNSSGCLFAVDVIDPQTLWECNASDMRSSTDGGQTWQDRQRGMGQPGCKLSAIDSTTAWYLNPRQLFATTDGGLTREEVILPEGLLVENIAAIYLRTATEGYLMDLDGNLYATTDSGETWSIRTTLDLSVYGELKLLSPRGLPSAAIRFLDDDHWLIVLSLAGGGANKTVALRTEDAGKTWREESVPAGFGVPYLSHDSMYLTIASGRNFGAVSVFHYTGDL